jgi:geranylgeranyl diphosphate synthase, type II
MKKVINNHEFVIKELKRYNQLTLDTLLGYLPNREPRKFLYDLVSDYPSRPGKGFRPGLCISTCKAFGGSEKAALNSAVAIELFHNAFLIHDDVEDESEFRRGKETLNKRYGHGIAINVGDAMNVLSLRPLMSNITKIGPVLTWSVFNEIEHMVTQCVEGQAMELGWVKDNICELGDGDYLKMILKKTCWYTIIHPCRIGCLIATQGEFDLDLFNRFGYFMGSAFQIQDDLLNLLGEESNYGKEIGGDIWEGKRTLILIHLFRTCSDGENIRLQQFLKTPRADRKYPDVKWVYDLMYKYNCFDYAISCAKQLAGAALKEFYSVYGVLPDSHEKDFIYKIILYMIEREL